MSSSYGENLKITVFGESHSAAIGVTIEGLPSGTKLDEDALGLFLSRRAPGQGAHTTARKEPDKPEFLCGVKDGVICGTPVTAIIKNTNTRSSDYSSIADTPRPGHADYTAELRYKGAQDKAGGGHFSGRLTAPLCIAGGICQQLLKDIGISINARIKSIGTVTDDSDFVSPVSDKALPVSDDTKAEEMLAEIAAAKSCLDSVGGVIECIISGMPVGIGDPMFGGLENRIASIVFGIPAVKGLEFGDGFEVARRRGSENNDAFRIENGNVTTTTNHCGGILGGISDGMPVIFRAAFKPTPSIGMSQQTVNLKTMKNCDITIQGRHDPCIVPRAVPVVEAAAAIAVYDAILSSRKE